METAKASWDTPVRQFDLERLIRVQESLDHRLEMLQESIERLRSDLIRVALAVGNGNERAS